MVWGNCSGFSEHFRIQFELAQVYLLLEFMPIVPTNPPFQNSKNTQVLRLDKGQMR